MVAFSKIAMFSALVALLAFSPALSADEWSGPWRDDVNFEITKTLIENNVRLCGEYKYKQSAKSKNEYIVHCTPDGKRWYAYIVWTGIGKIMGPYRPEIK